MKPPVPPSLRALLAGSVDYAGLFPPAGLALEPALENHAAYARGDDAWMLGRFVLPTGKLAETRPLLNGRFDSSPPLRISALGSKVPSEAGFLETLRTGLGELARFAHANGDKTAIDQFEVPLPEVATDSVRHLLREATELIETLFPGSLQVMWEVPFGEDLPTILRTIKQHNEEVSRISRSQPFGVKFRTGGVEASAFPSPAQLAGALLAARDAGVAAKFTAGLHHPLRHFNEEVGTRMHGFLNVFAAGILAREHRLDLVETQAILEDEIPESFRFDAGGFAWRDCRVSTDALTTHRRFITSFGSCSFDEPRDDLRHLGLMA